MQKYDPDIHCPDSFTIWDKLETRKTKLHEILKPNVSLAGTIPKWGFRNRQWPWEEKAAT